MKRILSFIIILCITFTVTSVPMYVNAQTDVGEGVLALLSYLEIMSGDPDGNMRLDDSVSRAEFSKMAVASSAHKNSVATGLALSPFPDVTYQHWAAPYVRVAVSNDIVSGYPNGTFEPESTVLYEEAVTMMLRVLGYKNDDFGYSWPSGQLGVAENIGLTDNIECSAGDVMTRRDVAQLVYNALKTELKDNKVALSSVFDIVISEEAAIIATHNEDSAIASDSVMTSSGTYKLDFDMDSAFVGMKGDIAVKNNNKIVGFIPEGGSTASEEYIVYSVFNNKILAYKNGSIDQIDVSDSTKVYKGSNISTFGQVKGGMELGDRLRVRRLSAGDIDYITYSDGNLLGPVTALNGNWQSLWNVAQGVKVTRNGASVTTSDIKNNDILYYISDMNMLMAYTDKVTGIYEAANPNRDAPTSIVVSGKTYNIEGSNAFNKIHSGGEFEYGDTVTLLLGKDGEAADAINPSANTEKSNVGYVISTGTKEYTSGVNTFKNYYIELVATDGVTYEYITDRDYTETKNSVVEVTFSNGYARLDMVSKASVEGKVDWNAKKIGRDMLSKNVNILDIGTTDKTEASMYKRIFGQRIDNVNITSGRVLYAAKNSSGEVTDLVLNDVTGDAHNYGLILSASVINQGMNVSSSYTFMLGGDRFTTTLKGSYNVSRGSAVKISGNTARPDMLSKIDQVTGSASLFTTDKIVIGGETHTISDTVSCYKVNSSVSNEYSMISINDVIENKNNYSITAFYDKSSESGGRVRVIVVSNKR